MKLFWDKIFTKSVNNNNTYIFFIIKTLQNVIFHQTGHEWIPHKNIPIVTFIYKPLQKLSSTGPRLYFTILGFYAIFSS